MKNAGGVLPDPAQTLKIPAVWMVSGRPRSM
jgi:hypothetical protein